MRTLTRIHLNTRAYTYTHVHNLYTHTRAHVHKHIRLRTRRTQKTTTKQVSGGTRWALIQRGGAGPEHPRLDLGRRCITQSPQPAYRQFYSILDRLIIRLGQSANTVTREHTDIHIYTRTQTHIHGYNHEHVHQRTAHVVHGHTRTTYAVHGLTHTCSVNINCIRFRFRVFFLSVVPLWILVPPGFFSVLFFKESTQNRQYQLCNTHWIQSNAVSVSGLGCSSLSSSLPSSRILLYTSLVSRINIVYQTRHHIVVQPIRVSYRLRIITSTTSLSFLRILLYIFRVYRREEVLHRLSELAIV